MGSEVGKREEVFLSATVEATTCMLHGFVMAQQAHIPADRTPIFAKLQVSRKRASEDLAAALVLADDGSPPTWNPKTLSKPSGDFCAFLGDLHTMCHSPGYDGKGGLVYKEWQNFTRGRRVVVKSYNNKQSVETPVVLELRRGIPLLAEGCPNFDKNMEKTYTWPDVGQLAPYIKSTSDDRSRVLVAAEIDRVYGDFSEFQQIKRRFESLEGGLDKKFQKLTVGFNKMSDAQQAATQKQANETDDNVGNISLYAQSTSSSDESLLSTPWFMYSLIGGCGVLLVVGVALCARRRRRASRRQRW